MSSVFSRNIFKEVIKTPLDNGCEEITVISGFASASFVRHILEIKPSVKLDLIVGMASRMGIAEPDHKGFLQLTTEIAPQRFTCRYYIQRPPCHIKAYAFSGGSSEEDFGYLGSANFTWGGFRDNVEAVTTAAATDIKRLHRQLLRNSIECTDRQVNRRIDILPAIVSTMPQTRKTHGVVPISTETPTEFVRLSLLTRTGEIHWHSGLNWGQRASRDPNQAYIPVSASVHNNDPDFFPPLRHRFLVQTDDGELFWCVTAQANRKGIHTPEDNSILGKYFRKRLGLRSGVAVQIADLQRYGRTDVVFYKVDGDLFLMDFSRPVRQ